MSDATWWNTLNSTVKKQILRIANSEAHSAGPISFDGIPDAATPRGQRAVRIQNARYRNHRKRVETALLLRSGALAYEDVRKCRYRRCSRLFLVPKSRSKKQSCSVKCGRNFRQSKFKRATRDRELARVRRAWRVFRGRPNRKEKTARKARVTPNFITYAIRRKELQIK
jgi:hypothetical protein